MVKVTYCGHSCFHLDDGTHRILFDPFLTGNPKARVRPGDFDRLDAVFVSHGHADHLGDAVELSKLHRAPIVAPFELAAFCQRRGAHVHGMHIGGSHAFDFGRVKLTIAHHGSAFVDTKTTEYTATPCGFLVRLGGGLTFYHAGDTGLFYDMKLLGEREAIDVAFLPIGDNFTMGPDDAATAVEFLGPRYAVPMHFGTFEILEPDPSRFVATASGLRAEIVVLTVGETREFTWSDPTAYLWVLRAASALLLGVAALALSRRAASRWLAATGVLPGLVPAAARTFHVGHLPLAGLHETLLTFGVCFPLVSALPCLRRDAVRAYGLCLAAGGLLLGLAAVTPAPPTPLVPALQTLWFDIHVASSFLAYACFGLGACAAVLSIASLGQGREGALIASAHRWGFAWFTWAMVSGGIWAYLAWGTYWLWHVKGLWSGILWTYYAGLVHLPHLAGWRGRRQAALSLVGFGLVVFTYLGVGLLMRNTHRF